MARLASPTMRRVVAVLAAVVMVVIALLVRAALDGDDGGGGGSGDDGHIPRLLCAEELEAVCQELEDDGEIQVVAIEPAGETIDRLLPVDAELDADGWLTIDPFPRLVDELRTGVTAPQFGDAMPTDRSTRLAIVAHADRAQALDRDCSEVDWACLADAAGDPWEAHGGDRRWGDVHPGYDSPDTSATGLLVLAQAVAQEVGNPQFATNDLTLEVVDFMGDLEDAVPNRHAGGTVLDTLVVQPPYYGAVGALGNAADAATRTDRGADLRIFYPAPMFRAEVVLAPAAGHDLELPDGLDDALAADGWDHAEQGERLPTSGTLYTLRATWQGVA